MNLRNLLVDDCIEFYNLVFRFPFFNLLTEEPWDQKRKYHISNSIHTRTHTYVHCDESQVIAIEITYGALHYTLRNSLRFALSFIKLSKATVHKNLLQARSVSPKKHISLLHERNSFHLSISAASTKWPPLFMLASGQDVGKD